MDVQIFGSVISILIGESSYIANHKPQSNISSDKSSEYKKYSPPLDDLPFLLFLQIKSSAMFFDKKK